MDEEQHRPRRLAGLRRADPLAEHPERDVALFRPVPAAPDLAALGSCRGSALRGRVCQRTDHAGAETEGRPLDETAPRQRTIEMFHDSSNQTLMSWIDFLRRCTRATVPV